VFAGAEGAEDLGAEPLFVGIREVEAGEGDLVAGEGAGE
jgi:hypothetical protein